MLAKAKVPMQFVCAELQEAHPSEFGSDVGLQAIWELESSEYEDSGMRL